MNNDAKQLMVHQRIHLNKLSNSPFSGLGIFDDVGTGKTISTLNIVNHHLAESQSPILIIVPPSIIQKWRDECRIWCGERVSIASYSNGKLTMDGRINILSHGQCKGSLPRSLPKIGLLIVDEAHHFRNELTQSSKIVSELCKSSEIRLILTATPIQNTVGDLVTITNLILPKFTREVIQAIVGQALGMNESSLFRPIMTRCTPTTNAATRVVNEHLVDMNDEERSFVFEVFKTSREGNSAILSEISKMKMAASSILTLQDFTGHNLKLRDSKVEYTSSLINNICNENKKVIVFTEFINTAKEISKNLDSNLIGTITGETAPDVRNSLLTGLRHSKRGAIVMTDVGGEGLDMQFVDCIVNHDLPWNPMVLEQRIGRLDRIGRDERDVEIHNILLKESLDSHIIKILKDKEMITHQFGGYGIMIDPISTLSSLYSSIQFTSLSSEIYDKDMNECGLDDYTSLSEDSEDLLRLISDLT